jgi:hypothetical protein
MVSLQTLPAELRLRIFDECLRHSSLSSTIDNMRPSNPNTFLLLLCKNFSNEIRSLDLPKLRLVFCDVGSAILVAPKFSFVASNLHSIKVSVATEPRGSHGLAGLKNFAILERFGMGFLRRASTVRFEESQVGDELMELFISYETQISQHDDIA